jgi:hypothetical protein
LSDRNYFKRAANTSNAIVIEAAFGRLTGAPVLQIAYPVRDGSQQLEFVLLASLDLTKFMQEQTEHLLHGFEVILTDHQGTVLFRPPARLGDWRDQHCVASVGVVFELAYSRFLSSQLLIERVNRVSCSRTTKSKTIVGLIVPVICSADFPRS